MGPRLCSSSAVSASVWKAEEDEVVQAKPELVVAVTVRILPPARRPRAWTPDWLGRSVVYLSVCTCKMEGHSIKCIRMFMFVFIAHI